MFVHVCFYFNSFVCKGSSKLRNKRRKNEKSLKSFVVSYILCTFASDDES